MNVGGIDPLEYFAAGCTASQWAKYTGTCWGCGRDIGTHRGDCHPERCVDTPRGDCATCDNHR